MIIRYKKKDALQKKNQGKRSNLLEKFLIVSLSVVLLFALVAYGEMSQKYSFEVGEISATTVVAPKDVENKVATEKERQAAAAKVAEVYMIDSAATEELKEDLSEIFSIIRYIRVDSSTDKDQKQTLMNERLPFQLTYESYNTALDVTTQEFTELEFQLLQAVEPILETGYKQSDIDNGTLKQTISSSIQMIKLPQQIRILAEDIVTGVLTSKPNLVLDEETTHQNKLIAMEAVEPVMIKKNMIIVDQGDVISEEQIEVLKSLDLLVVKDNFYTIKVLCKMAIILAVYVVAGLYLYFLKREIFNSTKYLLLINLLTVVALGMARVFVGIQVYAAPLFVISSVMIFGILINTSMAIVLSIFLSLLLGLVAGSNFYIVLLTILSSIIGALFVNKTNQRSKMTSVGIILALFHFLFTMVLEAIQGGALTETVTTAIWSGACGFVSAIVVIGLLPFLENWFSITTAFKLLELSNPNQPLLKKLMLEAPGTYHHSVLVANMAEAAADAVNGNGLLARVGAYYHDIGKMKRPGHFVENQLGGVNPHNKYTPSLSTLIISAHVKDGYEMAKQYKLPQEICDIIKQHHGDTLLAFFYNKAKELEPDKEVDDKAFRYEGPKPQFKEVGIIMLADSVEAATRAMSDPTKGKIDGLVRKIIKGKLNDGQLDQCDLTLKDLDTIATVFSKMLEGVYHSRIEYPDLK